MADSDGGEYGGGMMESDGIKTALEFIRADIYPSRINIDGHEYVSIEEYAALESHLADLAARGAAAGGGEVSSQR